MAESAHPSLPSLWRKRQRQLPCQLDSLLVAILQEVWRHEEKINSQLLLYIRCLLRNFHCLYKKYCYMKLSLKLCWDSHGQGESMKLLWTPHTAPYLCDSSLPGQVLMAGGQWASGLTALHIWHQDWEGCPCAAVGQVRHPGSLWGEISCESLVAGDGALDSGMRRLCSRQGGMQYLRHTANLAGTKGRKLGGRALTFYCGSSPAA